MLSFRVMAAGMGWGIIICFTVYILCLLAASVCDIRIHMVSDLIWWMAAADIAAFIGVRYGDAESLFDADIITAARCLVEALIVIFIQERVMSRYYGRADSHAFSCCALFFAVCGSCLEAHIIHMSMSLTMLTLVQACRGNICRGFRLRTPVPYIPYIALSFMLCYAVL